MGWMVEGGGGWRGRGAQGIQSTIVNKKKKKMSYLLENTFEPQCEKVTPFLPKVFGQTGQSKHSM